MKSDFNTSKEQDSYVMIKPGFANDNRVKNYVKNRILESGLKIVEEGEIWYDRSSAQTHYAEHFRGSYENAKGFYPELEDYIVSDKAYGMKVVGENAIAKIRALVGSTMKINKDTNEVILPAEGTIRYDVPVMLGVKHDMTKNVVHASDCVESAEKELAVFENLLSKEASL